MLGYSEQEIKDMLKGADLIMGSDSVGTPYILYKPDSISSFQYMLTKGVCHLTIWTTADKYNIDLTQQTLHDSFIQTKNNYWRGKNGDKEVLIHVNTKKDYTVFTIQDLTAD